MKKFWHWFFTKVFRMQAIEITTTVGPPFEAYFFLKKIKTIKVTKSSHTFVVNGKEVKDNFANGERIEINPRTCPLCYRALMGCVCPPEK